MAGGKMRCSCCYGEGGIHCMDAPILSLPRLKVLAWKGYVVIWLGCWSYDEVFVHQQICEEWSVRLYLMSSRVSTIGLPVDTLRPCCHSRRPSKTIPEEGGHTTLSGKIWASKILVWVKSIGTTNPCDYGRSTAYQVCSAISSISISHSTSFEIVLAGHWKSICILTATWRFNKGCLNSPWKPSLRKFETAVSTLNCNLTPLIWKITSVIWAE